MKRGAIGGTRTGLSGRENVRGGAKEGDWRAVRVANWNASLPDWKVESVVDRWPF